MSYVFFYIKLVSSMGMKLKLGIKLMEVWISLIKSTFYIKILVVFGY